MCFLSVIRNIDYNIITKFINCYSKWGGFRTFDIVLRCEIVQILLKGILLKSKLLSGALFKPFKVYRGLKMLIPAFFGSQSTHK